MTSSYINTILHYLAIVAPISFGAIIVFVLISNAVVFILYRKISSLDQDVTRARDELMGSDGSVHRSLARTKELLRKIDAEISQLDSKESNDLSINDDSIAEKRARLVETRGEVIELVRTIERNIEDLERIEPKFQEAKQNMAAIQWKIRNARGWKVAAFKFFIKSQEYFGNQPSLASTHEVTDKERSK